MTQVKVSTQVLASIYSLSVGVSKDDVASVIERISLTREDDTLVAMATDRYVALMGKYTDVEFVEWDFGNILVEPKALKSALDIAKSHGRAIDSIGIGTDSDGAHATIGATRVVLGSQNHNSFPPIDRLFTFDREPDGVGFMGIRPDFIGKLAKVLPPEVKPARDRVWRFEFRGTDSGKPGPVYAHYTGLGYELKALVQPALIQR